MYERHLDGMRSLPNFVQLEFFRIYCDCSIGIGIIALSLSFISYRNLNWAPALIENDKISNKKHRFIQIRKRICGEYNLVEVAIFIALYFKGITTKSQLYQTFVGILFTT